VVIVVVRVIDEKVTPTVKESKSVQFDWTN
jgi:hypothetical protein